MAAVLVKKTPIEATYIEESHEQEEIILFDSNNWIWPIAFWAVLLIVITLIGMGVVTG